MIEAITAPGPSSGERIGIEQMNDKITRPMMLLASAVRPPAIQSPTPVLVIRPIRNETNAMNGSTFFSTMSMVSRPAWYRVATMLPTNLPTLVTTLDRPVTNPFFFEDPRSLTELRPVFLFEKTGLTEAGKVKGRFRATGIRPKFYERLKQCGIVLPTQMFQTVVEIN